FLRKLLPGDAEWIELQSTIAVSRRSTGSFGELGRRGGAAVPAVRISRNRLTTTAAQELVDRLAARLADQIPHSDLHAADGRHHRGAALVLIANHATDHCLDVKRIAAQNSALHP